MATIGGRVAKKSHRKNPLLPNKPKKAVTGYGLFLRDYWTQNAPGGGARARDALRTASVEWRNLTEVQQNAYVAQAQPDRNRYTREINVWKTQRKALKRPASAYGLYLKSVWERERDSGRNVGEMGRHASAMWAAMQDSGRDVYRNLYREQARLYAIEMNRVKAGGEINPDWRTGGIPVPVEAVDEDEDLEEEDLEEDDLEEDDAEEEDEDDD